MNNLLNIVNFFLDIVNFIKFKSIEKNFKVGFFCENNYILNYLTPYIYNKIKKKKVLLISFEEIKKINERKV